MNANLCKLEDLKDGECRGFEIVLDGKPEQIFIVRKKDTIFGYFNECPHVGTPLNWRNTSFLTQDGSSQIICATHGALFRIEDGHCTAGPCLGEKLNKIDIRCIDGEVIIGDLAKSFPS